MPYYLKALPLTPSHRIYAVRFDRDRRFAPANPAIADMKSHAAAGSGTGEML